MCITLDRDCVEHRDVFVFSVAAAAAMKLMNMFYHVWVHVAIFLCIEILFSLLSLLPSSTVASAAPALADVPVRSPARSSAVLYVVCAVAVVAAGPVCAAALACEGDC